MTHEFQEKLYPLLPTTQYDLLTEVVTAANPALGQALTAQRFGAERLQTVRLTSAARDEALDALHAAQLAAQDAQDADRADNLDDIRTILTQSVWTDAALGNEVRGAQFDKARAMAQGAFRGEGDVLGMHLKVVSTHNRNGGATVLLREPSDVLLLELESGAWVLARMVAPLALPMFMTLDGKALELDSPLQTAYAVTFPMMTFDPAVVEDLEAQVKDAQAVMLDASLDEMDKLDAAALLSIAGQGVVYDEGDGTGTWAWRDGRGVHSTGSHLSDLEALLDLGRHLSR
ncbi:hypothetical protein K7W42_17910 [Deinococcus sp. HMF7604]|uniref:hypothetical protein n=1 Tax=Deinococcus betulae TaxID=2873312 RepID=UPI001CD02075|nr:hypothetical protein [Deinococcus betulae]MBZ9752720.1 hypothetical protein [Deinococcus betulae]